MPASVGRAHAHRATVLLRAQLHQTQQDGAARVEFDPPFAPRRLIESEQLRVEAP
ncbi:MAG: hypothetical protein ABI781_04695 [Burkholderiales bacterium]